MSMHPVNLHPLQLQPTAITQLTLVANPHILTFINTTLHLADLVMDGPVEMTMEEYLETCRFLACKYQDWGALAVVV